MIVCLSSILLPIGIIIISLLYIFFTLLCFENLYMYILKVSIYTENVEIKLKLNINTTFSVVNSELSDLSKQIISKYSYIYISFLTGAYGWTLDIENPKKRSEMGGNDVTSVTLYISEIEQIIVFIVHSL